LIIDGNDSAQYGLYGERCGMGSRVDQVFVTGCEEYGIWIGNMWQVEWGHVCVLFNGGRGIALGLDTFTWDAAGGAVFADSTIAGITAWTNGLDTSGWTVTDYAEGYGIGICTSESVTIHRIDASENYGVGLLDQPRSGTSTIGSSYFEDNCTEATASTRYQHWYQPINTAAGPQIRKNSITNIPEQLY